MKKPKKYSAWSEFKKCTIPEKISLIGAFITIFLMSDGLVSGVIALIQLLKGAK